MIMPEQFVAADFWGAEWKDSSTAFASKAGSYARQSSLQEPGLAGEGAVSRN